MKGSMIFKTFGVLAFVGVGLMLLNGCKSAPELTSTDAQKMIQAKYDQMAPAGITVLVNDQGMGDGVLAKYWSQTKRYPNGFWGDFTLTPEGKKVVKLPNGGEVIQWHPETPKDPHYAVPVITVAANHLKAHDVTDIQDEVLAGASTAKSASYTESVSFDGVPDARRTSPTTPATS